MIVFSDFDDTLHMRDDEAGFERNLGRIREFREKGNLFCIATGRSQSSLKRVWPGYSDYLDYAILDNGAVCLDGDGEVMFQETIRLALAEEIVGKILERFGGEVEFVFYHDAKEWPKLDGDVTKMRCWVKDVATSMAMCEGINLEYGKDVQGFVARTAVMSSAMNWVDNPGEYISFVDIMSAKAGKYNAIRRLMERYQGEKVVTVGDDTNDLAMIQGCDGYAMRNSVPEVLEVVKPGHVVGSVGEVLKLDTKFRADVD